MQVQYFKFSEGEGRNLFSLQIDRWVLQQKKKKKQLKIGLSITNCACKQKDDNFIYVFPFRFYHFHLIGQRGLHISLYDCFLNNRYVCKEKTGEVTL